MFPQIKYASDLSEPEMIPPCICDIKKDLDPETSTHSRRKGSDSYCFLCRAVSDTEVCVVSEAAQSLTLSLLTPGHWRK